MELLGLRRNADLTEGQLDALWAQTRQASESLALNILPSIAHGSPDDTGGRVVVVAYPSLFFLQFSCIYGTQNNECFTKCKCDHPTSSFFFAASNCCGAIGNVCFVF
jgi:hypothetical protein